MRVPPARRRRKRPNHVESPLRERPGNWYHVKLCGRRVRFCCETLTCLAFSHKLLGVLRGCEPIEPRSESFADDCLATRMMSAGSALYVQQKAFSVFGCDAPLQNSGFASLVKLAVDEGEGFGSPDDLPGHRRILLQLASREVRDVGSGPHWFD